MSWIQEIQDSQADELLQRTYQAISPKAPVANILKVHSLQPKVMAAHYALYRELMFGPSKLRRAEREMIAVAVSVVNGCNY